MLDHISDAFHILNTKYGRGLEFVIAGDTNDLNLGPILDLSPKFQQIVNDFTRLNPPAILDPIITTMPNLYQVPECLDPLDADPDKNGSKSDHKIVIAKPIDILNNKSTRQIKSIKVRPFPESGIVKMKNWFIGQSWKDIFEAETAHEKAEKFQHLLLEALDDIFPEKIMKISNDDQPWVSHKIKMLDRQRKRIYHKERRSEKWKNLNKIFKKEVKNAKSHFYKQFIADLKTKKPSQWYSCLKRLTSFERKGEQTNVSDISHLPDQEQAEIIADKFSSIPNMYDALKTEEISIPAYTEDDIPQFLPHQVWLILAKIKTNKATVPGDFPPKLIKMFAAYLAEPLTDIINTSVRRGEFPRIYKYEISTPVPKKYPPKNTSELRNISGLLSFEKIMETLLSQLIIDDMKTKVDPKQYGNQKGVSIQHYLIEMIHRILTALDTNSKGDTFAVIANMIDWNNAFPRQCPRLGIESFIQNGVRPALIPVLTNYFQDR